MLVRLANLEDQLDQQIVLDLLDMYARDPMGDGAPLAPEVRHRLLPQLRQLPQCRIFLAFLDIQPVGMALCFLGFSTFRARPLINIHDLAVSPEHRGQGIGRALLEAVEAEALRTGCCSVTLEVRADNHRAQRLYQGYGFQSSMHGEAMWFWKKPLG